MKAILSDIHGNLEALQAVLGDIESRGIEEIVCLGDVIGYGPNPRECLDLVRDVEILIVGNHEEAVLSGDAGAFNKRARRSVDWTRQQLLGEDVGVAGGEEAPAEPRTSYRELLARFVRSARDSENEAVLYTHGSPCNFTREYVMPRDARDTDKMKHIFEKVDSICFVGHTHVPGVFTRAPGADRWSHSRPNDLFGVYMDTGEKALVNVGSVGQPRDNDPRACYATFDMDTVVYHRVEYDVEAVAARIGRALDKHGQQALDKSFGERLRTGR